MKGYIICGIGTGIGKTLVATIVTEALEADYWKPIQAGNLKDTDSHFVKKHISNSVSVIHPETFRLKKAASPHFAAAKEKIIINTKDLIHPVTKNTLVIEPAGGLMVPINNDVLFIDWIASLKLPVILVSMNYLGSINHTLLSVEALRKRNITIEGIVFNHSPYKPTEDVILHLTGLKCLLRIKKHKHISKQRVKKYAGELRQAFFQ
jgi:dethiobiotin synthetase